MLEKDKQLFEVNTIRYTMRLGLNLVPHARKYRVCKVSALFTETDIDTL